MKFKEYLPDKKTSYVFIFSSLLMILYIYFGSRNFFLNLFYDSPSIDGDFLGCVYQSLSSFFLFFIIPSILIKGIFKEELGAYGFKRGDIKIGLLSIFVLVPLLIPFLYLASHFPDFQKEYPLPLKVREEFIELLKWEFFYFFYYVGWEFFFRGFMLFGFRDGLGRTSALLIQTYASTLMHIGKPVGETSSALIAGIVFGILAFRTESILYLIFIHYLVGFFTDLFCFLR